MGATTPSGSEYGCSSMEGGEGGGRAKGGGRGLVGHLYAVQHVVWREAQPLPRCAHAACAPPENGAGRAGTGPEGSLNAMLFVPPVPSPAPAPGCYCSTPAPPTPLLLPPPPPTLLLLPLPCTHTSQHQQRGYYPVCPCMGKTPQQPPPTHTRTHPAHLQPPYCSCSHVYA